MRTLGMPVRVCAHRFYLDGLRAPEVVVAKKLPISALNVSFDRSSPTNSLCVIRRLWADRRLHRIFRIQEHRSTDAAGFPQGLVIGNMDRYRSSRRRKHWH